MWIPSALSFIRTLLMNVGNSSLKLKKIIPLANNLRFQSKRLLDTIVSRTDIKALRVRVHLLNVMVVTFLVSVNSFKQKALVRNA